ncbi:MAG: hypothetical protein K6F68_08700 [Clostridiales bacterium]|nr:hypothetical protein [Clostridiales bacterium]
MSCKGLSLVAFMNSSAFNGLLPLRTYSLPAFEVVSLSKRSGFIHTMYACA